MKYFLTKRSTIETRPNLCVAEREEHATEKEAQQRTATHAIDAEAKLYQSPTQCRCNKRQSNGDETNQEGWNKERFSGEYKDTFRGM